MKKMLIVAALLATTAVPATPSYAATMAMPAPNMTVVCFLLPLLPDCISMWKGKHDEMMSKMGTMPKMAMPMMPTCTKAAAGSGHLMDCK